MIGVKSLFTEAERKFMKDKIGVEFSDSKDYSEDELMEIYELILEKLPYEYDSDGRPQEAGWLFEFIIDRFHDYLIPD